MEHYSLVHLLHVMLHAVPAQLQERRVSSSSPVDTTRLAHSHSPIIAKEYKSCDGFDMPLYYLGKLNSAMYGVG